MTIFRLRLEETINRLLPEIGRQAIAGDERKTLGAVLLGKGLDILGLEARLVLDQRSDFTQQIGRGSGGWHGITGWVALRCLPDAGRSPSAGRGG